MTPEDREELEEALSCLYDAEHGLRQGLRYYPKKRTRNARKCLERVLHPQEEVEP